MVLGFFQRFEIKYIMKLTNNPPNVLGRKTAVFHRVDYIPPASVVLHGSAIIADSAGSNVMLFSSSFSFSILLLQ